MTFPRLSMTFAIFHDFPGLENGLPKFHDFPWPGDTLKRGIQPVEHWLLVCWWWRTDWSFARPIAPVVTTTATINLDVNKIHNCCPENGCQMSRLLLLLLLSNKPIVGARYSQVMQPNILNRDNLLTVIRLPQRSLSSHHLANTNNLTRTTKRQDRTHTNAN